MIKKMLKKIIPTSIKNFLVKFYTLYILLSNYFYDIWRFIKHSSTFSSALNEKQLEAKIFAHYHVIEKGLSFKNVRLGFGYNVVLNLLSLLEQYKINSFNTKKISYESAISCLYEYIDFHKKNKYQIDDNISLRFEKLKNNDIKNIGGVNLIETSPNTLHFSFAELMKNRHSIRNFAEGDIPIKDIEESVSVAQKSPSVCNRQGTQVYIIKSKDKISEILKLNNGNKGFGKYADKLIIITTDLSIFTEITERNQGFVDSGIFTMSLLLALTEKNIGTCTINWCVDRKTDIKLRNIINITESENVALMILVGGIPKILNIAKSSRRETSDILRIF